MTEVIAGRFKKLPFELTFERAALILNLPDSIYPHDITIMFAAMELEQIRIDHNCKCGPKFGWLSKLPIPQFCFKSDCCFHDLVYALANGGEDFRKKCDKQFYYDMKMRVRQTKKWYQRWNHYLLAYIYYRAVRISGKAHFVPGNQHEA